MLQANNYDTIWRSNNLEAHTYTLGLNQFAHMTREEFDVYRGKGCGKLSDFPAADDYMDDGKAGTSWRWSGC
jgi:hypothetical protein